jgi:hypothetical protein
LKEVRRKMVSTNLEIHQGIFFQVAVWPKEDMTTRDFWIVHVSHSWGRPRVIAFREISMQKIRRRDIIR